MRLSVDHGLRVMDITKAALLRLKIIKLRLQYNLKMQVFERTKTWPQAKNIYNLYDVGVKTINKFNPIPYSTLKNSYFVVYRRGLGNI